MTEVLDEDARGRNTKDEPGIDVRLSDERVVPGVSPIVVLGPNGAGKTRYGVQLKNTNRASRIPAFRNIASIGSIPMQPTHEAEQNFNRTVSQVDRRPWKQSSEIQQLLAMLQAKNAEESIRFRERASEGDLTKPGESTMQKLKNLGGHFSRAGT